MPISNEYTNEEEVVSALRRSIAEASIGMPENPIENPTSYMFESYDNVPIEIRPQFIALDELLQASINDFPAQLLTNVYSGMEDILRNAHTYTGPNTQEGRSAQNLLEYIDYLTTVLRWDPVTRKPKVSTQIIANIPDKRSKLFAPMGIEFSYHAPLKDKAIKDSGTISGVSGLTGTNADIIRNIPNFEHVSEEEVLACYNGDVSEHSRLLDERLAQNNSGVSGEDVREDLNDFMYGDDVDVRPVNQAIGRSERSGRLYTRLSRYNEETGQSEREPWNLRTENDSSSRVYNNRRRVEKNTQYYTDKLKRILKDNGLMEGYGSKVYKDGATVVEVCSPVHKNWKSMRDWFSVCDRLAKQYGYLPWKRTSGGGGMHLNISYNKTVKNWKLAYTNFFILIANHPELNWIFNEPSDDHTANALIGDKRFIEAYHECANNNFYLTDDIWNSFAVCGGKDVAINAKDAEHFEIRTFEMVRSTSDFKDVIELYNAMLGFCMEVAEWGIMIPLDVDIPVPYRSAVVEERGYLLPDDREENTLVFDRLMWSGESKFNELLRGLKLDPKKYRKYVRRNYHARRGDPYGEKYFR